MMTTATLFAVAGLWILVGAALVGCPRPVNSSTDAIAPACNSDAAGPSSDSGESAVAVWIVRSGNRDGATEAQSSSGALRAIRAAGVGGASVVAKLRPISAVHKVSGLVGLLDLIEASGGNDPALRFFLQVDASRATRERLRAAGFEADTLAADVATGTVRLRALERVLGSDLVRHLPLRQSSCPPGSTTKR